MMDITAILHMHAELSLTAVFILMFLLDLFLPAPQRHWLRPMACILLTIQLLANLWPEEVTFIWRHVSLNPYGVCSEKHPDHRYHTGFSTSRPLAKT